ncbi:hypothetical protein ACFL07_02225 [Pseudomonadota bacterium]
MIRLFTTMYYEKDSKRKSEYRDCLERNIACVSITEICILCEGGEEVLPKSEKIKIRHVSGRPTYRDYFDWNSELATNADVSIVANTDIYFDHQLTLFSHWRIPENTIFALSRWDFKEESKAELYDHNDSQDTWIFRGTPVGVFADIPVGVPRCDNRIAAEFEKAGYRVLNPSFSLRCYHLHDSPPRPYMDSAHSEQVSPPYKYIWPHNLFGLSRTIFYNLRYPDSPVHWRFDRRKFNRQLPMRLFNKFSRLFRHKL